MAAKVENNLVFLFLKYLYDRNDYGNPERKQY